MMLRVALFPLGAVLFSLLAYWQPQWLMPFQPAIMPLLGVIMFGMGMTLTATSFTAVWQRPGVILFGLLLQYGLMPFIAWGLGYLLGLPLAVIVGLVLVGSCPGGTASNVICYLARGDVALSITLTALSTLLALLATPALTWLYIGQRVPVPVAGMLLDILAIIVIPVATGLLLRHWLGDYCRRVEAWFAPLSMLAILFIIGIVVALSQAQLTDMAAIVALAVVLHNGFGLVAGYGLARLAGLGRIQARTLAIEVGMQNSGLGVALALKYFGPLSALPGALFSIWHNISGALLAAVLRRHDDRHPDSGE
ncbi:BASS family bile acid:Na+ symporter [Methylohalomonas lacus]|uniref:BASS family bile acid:Na+ symporter n=1 Tax=Methylohalomonas lacus TaxID=398773 RepID=A0AAE3HJF3_9GAMM|nr:bile acid:sodium symporter family protein [Methylohalomonas lacus]MCS3903484.1 BASS family bile acid:Na+ symporter [Methylohalomonas lacus]